MKFLVVDVTGKQTEIFAKTKAKAIDEIVKIGGYSIFTIKKIKGRLK